MSKDVYILGIESSCDETAAAVVKNGREVLSNIISSQIVIHRKFGGVVPEIASRKHIENIMPVIDEALQQANVTLDDIDAIAVTYGPGIVGALLVGLSAAKSLAWATDKPLIGVNHLEGHVFANFLTDPELEPPFMALVVSGGHTALLKVTGYNSFEMLGQTRDDAAGEAFDKIARVLGLPYPGGRPMQELAEGGDDTMYPLPRAKLAGNDLDMSFSGLKTAAVNLIHNAEQKGVELDRSSLAASVAAAISDELVPRAIEAARRYGHKTMIAAGGVAANKRIRADLERACEENGIRLFLPPLKLCGDNGAMIGAQAYYEYLAGTAADMSLNAYANLEI